MCRRRHNVDNGSEFINGHLLAYCEQHEITFTRGRPEKKNDGCDVEQKNWTRVRELVGYYRYDTTAELEILNQIWELDDAFANYFLPSQKLATKHRDGAKVVKTYHQAATPHQRARAHPAIRKRPVITMNARFKRLRLGASVARDPRPHRPPRSPRSGQRAARTTTSTHEPTDSPAETGEPT